MKNLGALALLSLLTLACVSLAPYAEVERQVPGQLVPVGSQRVHVVDQGRGEPVLLLHGFGGSTAAWRHVQEPLASRFRVIALDLNGFGWTERPADPNAYTLDGQLALVLGVMDGLGLARAHVVGHSYGGGLALWMARQAPERVGSLVLVDAAHPSYSVERRTPLATVEPLVELYLRVYALRPNRVRRALLGAYADDDLVTPELVATYLAPLRVEGSVRAYQGLTSSGVGGPIDLDLGTIDHPALVIWGAQDEIIDPTEGAEATAKMPQARFELVDGAGHNPMEERPQPFLDLVVAFLTETKHASASPGRS